MWSLFRRNARQARPARRTPPTFCPRLEALEDRCVPTAGALDPTFGNGAGYVTTALSAGLDIAAFPVIQPDGKILEVGLANKNASGMVRYNADGTLDTSFGSGGTVIGPPTLPVGYEAMAALYPTTGTANDGKIVLAGISSSFSLTRYNSNGTLDTSFGANGVATANFGSTLGSLGSSWAVIQPDGKIDAIGVSSNENTLELARFNADGSLDTTFGQGGMVTTSFGGSWRSSEQTLLVQPNGGLNVSTGIGAYWKLIEYNADGSLNTSFGNGGIVTPPPISSHGDGSAGYESAALYPTTGTANDGKIVMAGYGYTSGGEGGLLVRRFNPDGTLDPTFGNGGASFFTTGEGVGAADGVVLQPDGKVLVTCSGANRPLVRLNTDGSLDNTFGSGGVVSTPIGTSPVNRPGGLALQPNGDIVVARTAVVGTKSDFALVRYLGDSPSFLVSGFPSSVTAGTSGTFTVTARNADGSVNTGYLGTVHFTSSDPKVVLPADYTFTAADQGVHTFSATLKTAGSQSIIATDTTTGTTFGGDAGIVVTPAAASQFILSAPSSVSKGSKFSVTLTVEDAFGNVVTGYIGTVHFTSSDGTATLPVDYTFTAADAGVHTFTKMTVLRKKGNQTLTATDTQNSALTATDSINVA